MRRLGLHRVVELYAGSVATGYAVTADLVLTARHALGDAEICDARPLGAETWVSAEVVWRGEGSLDAALVRLPGAPWEGDPEVPWTRWGSPGGNGVPCTAHGFPRAQAHDRGDRQLRDAETLTGSIDVTTSVKMGRYSVNIATPAPTAGADSAWRGMSGAVLLAGTGERPRARQLLGVICADPSAYGGRRVEAVPVAALLHDEDFARLVGADPSAVEEVTVRENTPLLEDFLSEPFEALPANAPDWFRLLPRYKVVDFLGRDDARRRLREWCIGGADAPRLSVAVITGDGGSGKTRLAGQLCLDMDALGWDAGFCDADGLGALTAGGRRPEVPRPALVVVDDPEPLTTGLAKLVMALAVRGHGAPVRLLLLARAGSAPDGLIGEDWWRQLTDATHGYLGAGPSPTVVALNQHPLSPADRRLHAAAALHAFGAGPSIPGWPLDDDAYGNPLRVHLAALLAVRGEDVSTVDGILRRFLNRETEFWMRGWEARRGRPSTPDERGLVLRSVALVTLTAPLRAELPALVTALPGAGEDPGLAGWLAGLFPGTGDTVSFGPDILAETLLDTVADLGGLLDGLYRHPARAARHVTRMLDTLLPAADRPAVLKAFYELVSAHFTDLIALALGEPEPTLADTVDSALRLLCRTPEYATGLAVLAAGMEPAPSTGHRGLLAALADLRVARLRADPARSASADLAGELCDLAAHAAAMGRYAEAAEHAVKAVEAYRGGRETDPAYPVALHNAAACLLALGQSLRAGEYATEAFEAYAAIYGDDEDSAPYEEICEVIVTLAACELAAGNDPARAVAMLQDASEGVPEDRGLEPMLAALQGLAGALPSRSPRGDVAATRPVRPRGQAAEDVTASIRALAEEIAESYTSVFHQSTMDPPEFARLLVDVAVHSGWRARETMRSAYLEHAITLLRERTDPASRRELSRAGFFRLVVSPLEPRETLDLLAWLRPLTEEVGEPGDLIVLYLNEGAALAALGRTAEAVAPLRTAVEVHGSRGGDEDDYGAVCLMLGLCLQEIGDLGAAVSTLDDAAAAYRQLTATDPQYAPELRDALSHLAVAQVLNGVDPGPTIGEIASLSPPDDAGPPVISILVEAELRILREGPAGLAAAEESMRDIRRRMEAELPPDPDAVQAYAGVVIAVAGGRAVYGRAADGLALLRDCTDLVNRYIPDDDRRAVVFLGLQSARGQCHLGFGAVADATADLEAAVTGLKARVSESPMLRVSLWQAQYSLARAYAAAGRFTDAEAAALDGLDVTSRMAESPDTDRIRGATLSLLALSLAEQLRIDEAIECADEAVALMRGQPELARLPLATAHHAKGEALVAAERWTEAVAPLQETIRLLRPIADGQALMLASVLELVGFCRYLLNDPGFWPPLSEGTDRMRAARDTSGFSLPAPLCVRHAFTCAVRAEWHAERDAPLVGLHWIVEAMWATTQVPDDRVALLLPGVLAGWMSCVDGYAEPADLPAETAEPLRALGRHTGELLGRLPADGMAPEVSRLLAGLAAMEETGTPPLDATRAFAVELDSDDEEDDAPPPWTPAPPAALPATVSPAIGIPVSSAALALPDTARAFREAGRLDLAANSLHLWAAALRATGDHASTPALLAELAALVATLDGRQDAPERLRDSIADTLAELDGLWRSA